MKKLLLTTAAVLALASPAAAQSLSFGGGFNLSNVITGVGAASQGTAAAGSIAAGSNQSLGAGFATSTPVGSLTAGIGASTGTAQSLSGAASIGNGAAATGGFANSLGAGAGLGIALP